MQYAEVEGPELQYTKGTLSCYTTNYYYLSPCIGAALAHSHFLHNLYEFGLDMQMTKLVRSLFFRLNSSEPLRCTRNKSLPASWITPRRMGRLVGILMASNDQDLETWVQRISDVSGGEKKGCSKKKVWALIDTIRASLLECSGSAGPDAIFCAHTTYVVLTAFVWMKSTSKADVLKYMKGLMKHFPAAFTSSLPDGDEVSKWEHSHFIRGIPNTDFTNGIRLTNQMRPVDIEAAVFYAEVDRANVSFLPPQVSFGTRSFEQSTVSDCMETQMRNAINILMYNPMKKAFELNHLPPTFKPCTALVDFFTRLHPVTQQPWALSTGPDTCQAWFNLTTHHKNIDYIRRSYEVRPSVSNFVALFNALFGLSESTVAGLASHFNKDGSRCYRGVELGTDHATYPRTRRCIIMEERSGYIIIQVFVGGRLQVEFRLDLTTPTHAKGSWIAPDMPCGASWRVSGNLLDQWYTEPSSAYRIEPFLFATSSQPDIDTYSMLMLNSSSNWFRIHCLLLLPKMHWRVSLLACIACADKHPCFETIANYILKEIPELSASSDMLSTGGKHMLARSPVRGPRILARMKNSVIWLLKHNNSTVLSAVKAILEVEPLRLYDQNERGDTVWTCSVYCEGSLEVLKSFVHKIIPPRNE